MKVYKNRKLKKTISYLNGKKKILFLTTSNRWVGDSEKPKSTFLAEEIARQVGEEKVIILDITRLNIVPCEGNVSTQKGNSCGLKDALLNDLKKNPSGCHRCWASINNPEDELWKVSQPLLEADCVIFFGSIRWGQMNSFYQKLIERLTWLENRHSTLGEENILKNIDAGIIATGHNWNGKKVIQTQMQVLEFFGFKVVKSLCWNWQFTRPSDESSGSYAHAFESFRKTFLE